MMTTLPKPISLTKAAQVQAAIDAAEGRATSRTLTADDLAAAAARAEKRLADIPKRLWTGTTVHVAPHRVPNSYGYRADSTQATLVRRTQDWAVTAVGRARAQTASYGSDGDIRITLPATTDRADLLAALLNARSLSVATADHEEEGGGQ
jgi:hypothetical protein